ncbi:hypothetical protein MPNT_80055 [Candidatus Methylacidithermus pantelleriae]|uniref:Uncharacterized protein n=2 Tax=Candidatus Methylacidithermus pantelleriae TaxID=2744239 RepID=A0A8J2FPT4_9BACT|nr:hypothetical protein MPNT_80055 [Candidatus Methylacidithermus pantelleriae]
MENGWSVQEPPGVCDAFCPIVLCATPFGTLGQEKKGLRSAGRDVVYALWEGLARVAQGKQNYFRIDLHEYQPEVKARVWDLLEPTQTVLYYPGPPVWGARGSRFPGVWLVAQEDAPRGSVNHWIEVGSIPKGWMDFIEKEGNGRSELPASKPNWIRGLLCVLAEGVKEALDKETGWQLDLSPWIVSEAELSVLMQIIGKGPLFAQSGAGWNRLSAFSSRWPRLWWVRKRGPEGRGELSFEIGMAPRFLWVDRERLWKSAMSFEEVWKACQESLG